MRENLGYIHGLTWCIMNVGDTGKVIKKAQEMLKVFSTALKALV